MEKETRHGDHPGTDSRCQRFRQALVFGGGIDGNDGDVPSIPSEQASDQAQRSSQRIRKVRSNSSLIGSLIDFSRKCPSQFDRAQVFCTRKIQYFLQKHSILSLDDSIEQISSIVQYFYLFILGEKTRNSSSPSDRLLLFSVELSKATSGVRIDLERDSSRPTSIRSSDNTSVVDADHSD